MEILVIIYILTDFGLLLTCKNSFVKRQEVKSLRQIKWGWEGRKKMLLKEKEEKIQINQETFYIWMLVFARRIQLLEMNTCRVVFDFIAQDNIFNYILLLTVSC